MRKTDTQEIGIETMVTVVYSNCIKVDNKQTPITKNSPPLLACLAIMSKSTIILKGIGTDRF